MKRLTIVCMVLLGLIAANCSAQEPQAAGYLQPSGGYLARAHGSTASLLADGSILLYGSGMATNEWRSQQDQNNALRQPARILGDPDAEPKFYDPAHHGWHKLADAPECKSGSLHLHTATVLAHDQVLIAGGLCTDNELATGPTPEYAGLSLWDSATRHWLPVPALPQTRIFHTATLMPDRSVLLVGGESDPRLSQGSDEPVLSSVLRYARGKVVAVPPMAVTRAKHAATLLADGSVLVTGGFDAHDNPLASAELLNPAGSAWLELPPMHVARYGHTATLLADGRVLVAGGIGQDGRLLRSVEIWDPHTDNWTVAADLPVGLYGHAAARLPSGDVLVAGGAWLQGVYGQSTPWAWLWDPRTSQWQLAGRAAPTNEGTNSSPVSLSPRPDGSVLMFTPSGVLRWMPGAPTDGNIPAWQSPPAITELPGRRLMLVGYLADNPGAAPNARIWNADGNQWSDAGALAPDTPGGKAETVTLPSGDVAYVAVKPWHALSCQRWHAADNNWSSCGEAQLQYLTSSRPQLGLLPDGRVFALANLHEAAVLDANADRWTDWNVEWHTDAVTFGAPVRGKQPITTLIDPANGQRFEENDAGARYLHGADLREFDSISMLWNPQKGWWDYVLRGMGNDARRLPDGCVVSTHPIALYRPSDARVFPLPDPGFGSTEHSMTAMDDGTVVVVGPGNGTFEPGAGFFHRKASCGGFSKAPADATYISPTAAVDPITPPVVQPASPPPSPSPWRGAWRTALGLKWFILACIAPWVAYRLLRKLRWPQLRGGYSLALRLLLYGGLAIILMPWVLALSHMPSGRWHQMAASARDAHQDAAALRKHPCELVGLWTSTRKGIMYRIELTGDGRYALMPDSSGKPSSANPTGRWGIRGDSIVWRDDRSGTVDVNPMVDVSDGRFQVIENDGTHTQFDRVEARQSNQCDKR